MKKNRIIAVFLGLTLLLIVIAAWFYSRNIVSDKNFLPVSEIKQIEAPRLFPKFNTVVEFTFSGEIPIFPTSLSAYTISYDENLLSKISNFSQTLNLPDKPISPVSWVYDWKNTNTILSYNSQAQTLSFIQWGESSELVFSPQDLLSSLFSANIYNNSFRFDLLNSSKVKADDLSHGVDKSMDEDAPPAVINTYQFIEKESSIPIWLTTLLPYSSEIRTDENNKVISGSFMLPPNLVIKERQRELLTVDEAVAKLNEQKGLLIGVTSQETEYPFKVTPSFSSVSLSSVVLIYLYIKEESIIAPVYIFSGIGRGSQGQQEVKYMLRASS